MGDETSNKYDNHWLELINSCYESGLSVKQWCNENKIANSTFYYQLKRLRNKACELPARISKKETISYHQDVVPLKVDDDISETARIPHDAFPENPENFSVAIRISTQRGI